MSGVEILAIEEVAVEFAFNWTAFFITLGITFVLLGLTGLAVSNATSEWSNLLIGVVLGATFGCIFGAIFGNIAKVPIEYEPQYKVVISDEILMNEFVDRYEIIEQDGKIYTVAERLAEDG